MFAIFDHLSSIVIAAGVVLILLATQHRSTHASVEQVATHSVKAKTLVFGHWIERDLLDLGKNLGRNRYRFKPPTTDSLGNTGEFHFFSDSTCTSGCTFPGGVSVAVGDTARLHTRYSLVPTDRVLLRDSLYVQRERQLMRLDREVAVTKYVNGVVGEPTSGQWRRDRWSMGTLSGFQIDMLKRDGTISTSVDEGDYIFVRFSVVPQWLLDPENYIREIYWSTTLKIRPYWEPPPDRSS